MNTGQTEKDVVWLGDSLSVLQEFPKSVRILLGSDLRRLQLGELPLNAKSIRTVALGARELRARYRKSQYRVIYVTVVRKKVLVLHCFIKKSRATPLTDIDTAKRRLKAFSRS